MIKKKEQIKDLKAIQKLLRVHIVELERNQKNIPNDIFEVTHFLLQENFDTYNSVILLYKKNDYRSCLILARSIIENSVNLQYIYKENIEKRALNYKLYSLKVYLERVRNLKKVDERLAKTSALFKEELQKYSPSGENSYHWDGKSVKKILDDLDQKVIYHEFYSRMSSYVHAQFKNNRDLRAKRPYNDFLKKLICNDCALTVLESLRSINNKYNLQEGVVIIKDYPNEGNDLIFPISDNTGEYLKYE